MLFVIHQESRELLAKLELEVLDLILEREGFAGSDMWSVLVVQSELIVDCRPGWPKMEERIIDGLGLIRLFF